MLTTVLSILRRDRHRLLVVISGEQSWCNEQLLHQLATSTVPTAQPQHWLLSQHSDHPLRSPQPLSNVSQPDQQPHYLIAPLTSQQAPQRLGQECDALIIDGFSGIDLNALGILVGCIKAGGFCYLLCPELDQWPYWPDPQAERFDAWSAHSSQPQPTASRLITHLINTIMRHPTRILLSQRHGLTPAKLDQYDAAPDTNQPSQSLSPSASVEPDTATTSTTTSSNQQIQAVALICKVASGHRRRPLVITADRGRGKSSALGIAVAQLFNPQLLPQPPTQQQLNRHKQGTQIIITAPRLENVEPVFAHASRLLPDASRHGSGQNTLSYTPTNNTQTPNNSHYTLTFIPIDVLIEQQPPCDLLFIDEAAAIPAPLLTQLLQHYPRIVFTTTIAGYEGTGRGFEIRFKQSLNQFTPQWTLFHIEQPIRWAVNDPLEQWLNQTLLLAAQATKLLPCTDNHHPVQVQLCRFDRDQLVNDHAESSSSSQLSQIMGLLIQAHYKTSPNDFRHLLAGNNIQLYGTLHQQQVIAVAMIAIEGQLPSELALPIWRGERRLRGHLLAQSFSCHSGFCQASSFSYGRVVRIAVSPAWQQQHLGSQLLDYVSQQLQQQQIDFIGASFGATCELITFWQANQMAVVRLGISKEATSNEYSAMVLKPLATDHDNLNQQQHFYHDLKQQFEQQFSGLLCEFYQQLDPALVLKLLQQHPKHPHLPLNQWQLDNLDAFIHHQRDYEFCSGLLQQVALLTISQGHGRRLTAQQQTLLVNKVLRQQSWAQIKQQLNLTSKKAAHEALKQVFAKLTDAVIK